MSTPVIGSGGLTFRGAPDAVEGLAPIAYDEILANGCSVMLHPAPGRRAAPVRLQTVPAGSSATCLRLSLPETTPPGTYDGVVSIGERRYRAAIHVEPVASLVLSPSRLVLHAPPGAERVVELTAVNTGNVVWDVPKAHGLALFEEHGLERGIGAALRGGEAKPEERLDRLTGQLVESHGGLVRVAVQEGAGRLAPGELRGLRVVFRLTDRLKPGHMYVGTWPLLNLRYHVQVHVTEKDVAGKDTP